MATAPDELQGLATLTPADGGTINVIVVYVGDTGAGQRVLSPLRSIATVTRDTVERRTYADTFTMPPYGEVVPTSFFAVRGAYLATLSDEAIEAALSCYAQAPAGCTIGLITTCTGQSVASRRMRRRSSFARPEPSTCGSRRAGTPPRKSRRT